MGKEIYTKIIASGSYIPEVLVKNDDFLSRQFYDSKDRKVIDKPNREIIDKFHEILERGKNNFSEHLVFVRRRFEFLFLNKN